MNRQNQQQAAHIIVLKLVEEIRATLPRAGVPKIYHLLQGKLREHQIKMGRDALYNLLDEHGYLLRYRRKRIYTTNSNHPYKKYPNLIREMKYLTHPGQLWVSDITYLRLSQGFSYLSIVTDAYSHKVIGYCLHHNLVSEGPLRALQMAIGSKRSPVLIHHSDRGIQYCCIEYVQMLEHYNIKISMTENGDPYENSLAERVNGVLKNEFLLDRNFSNIREAEQAVMKAIEAYNHIRPHDSCNKLTPAQAHAQSGYLQKRWKSRAANEEICLRHLQKIKQEN